MSFEDLELGELEVMLQNLNEGHAHCPFRFHTQVFEDYCDVLTRDAHKVFGVCPNQNYTNSLIKGDVSFPKCDYFINKIALDYEIYKRKR